MKIEHPAFTRMVELGILQRVYVDPDDPGKNRYRMIDPEGVKKALEELGLWPLQH